MQRQAGGKVLICLFLLVRELSKQSKLSGDLKKMKSSELLYSIQKHYIYIYFPTRDSC